MTILAELKRRNVIRMAGLYLVGAWLIAQIAETLLPIFHTPEWVLQVLVVLLAIGFLPALVFAWIFELTPEGLKRDAQVAPEQSIASTTSQRMNRMIIALLVMALGYFVVDKFVLSARHEALLSSSQEKGAGVVSDASVPSDSVSANDPDDTSIAVLPFVNMSSDKEQEYFSDGLSEELLNQLAQVPQLRVIARTSSFSFKGKEVAVSEIAKALNVAHVLEGSVRKSGDTLRITAQLIRTSDSSHLWSQTYDRQLTDVFKIQDEISTEVVSALKLKLLPQQQIPKAQGTTNIEAYEHFLRGTDYFRKDRLQLAASAEAEFRQAIARDPAYANAYLGLATSLAQQAELASSPVQRDDLINQSLAALDRSIALDPGNAYAYSYRGYLRYSRAWDWVGAAADFKQAEALDPNNALLRSFYSMNLFLWGKPSEGIAMARKAVEIDPLSAGSWSNLGMLYFCANQNDEARPALQRALELQPDSRWANYVMGLIELEDDSTDRALAHFRAADESFRLTGEAMVEYTLGHEAESQQALAELIAKYSIGSAFQVASIHAWRGEKDQAFEWLNRAYDQHDSGMPRLRYDPTLESLRDDPRFTALVKKMGFPE